MKQVFAALAALPACALLSACLKPAPEAARDAEPWDRPVAAVETATYPRRRPSRPGRRLPRRRRPATAASTAPATQLTRWRPAIRFTAYRSASA